MTAGNGDIAVSNENPLDIKQYEGDWYSGFCDEPTGNPDVSLSLDTENSKVSIYNVSENRTAQVDETYEIKGSKAEFEFKDDGWGNSGRGTIEFNDDELVVEIVIDDDAENLTWGIFEGELVFDRDNNNSNDNGDNSSEVNEGDNGGSSEPDSDSGLVIKLGNTGFDLEKPLTFEDLVSLTADELAILRNGIFAKHGYIFKTQKYTDLFSEFEWYDPIAEDVNSKLTEEDKSCIALIQKVERFYAKKVKLSDEEKKLIGFWNCGAGVAAGYSNVYRFYGDGTYKYSISQMVGDERNVTHAGKWFVMDGKLYLRIEREGVLVGGELVDAETPGIGTEKEIIDADYKVQTLDTIKPAVLDMDFDSDKLEDDYNSNGVLIDDLDFYKLSPDPDKLYDGYDI